jgi:hypothetical protein
MNKSPHRQPKVLFTTRIPQEIRDAVRRYREVVGVPDSQQVERALREWLAERSEAWPVPRRPASRKGGAR